MDFLAELVVCSGFFLIYLLEELVHQLVQPQRDQISASQTIPRSSQPSKTGNSGGNSIREEERVNSCCDATNHNDMEMQTSVTNTEPGYNPKYSVRLSDSTSSVFPNYHAPDSLKPLPQENPSESPPLFSLLAMPSVLRDFFLVLAVSFHAVFEGLAIGLEDSSEDVWKMLATTASHKFVLTFSVSLQLMQGGTTRLGFALFLITFTLISPLGIGVGLALLELTAEVDQVTVAVLQGLAGGAIIYLVMFELIQRERGRDVAALLQLVPIIFITSINKLVLLSVFCTMLVHTATH